MNVYVIIKQKLWINWLAIAKDKFENESWVGIKCLPGIKLQTLCEHNDHDLKEVCQLWQVKIINNDNFIDYSSLDMISKCFL